MSTDKPLSGGAAVAVPARALWWAVDELVRRLEPRQLSKLDVRAGEHLAALITTAFLGTAPTSVDTAGGVDLTYDLQDRPGRNVLGLSDEAGAAAFEVKSLGHAYREFEGRINKVNHGDGNAAGRGLRTTIVGANDVLRQAQPLLLRACEQLDTKVGPEVSKNIFLLVNPFDHPTVECLTYPIIGRLLEPIQGIESVDSVWILWVPDHITVWSARNNSWADLLIAHTSTDPEPSGPMSILQEAEDYFLSHAPGKAVSPFLFSFTVE